MFLTHAPQDILLSGNNEVTSGQEAGNSSQVTERLYRGGLPRCQRFVQALLSN